MNIVTSIFAFAAFVLSAIALYLQWQQPNMQSHGGEPLTTMESQIAPEDYELISDANSEVNELDIAQLQQVINRLNKRLTQLEQYTVAAPEQITEIVDAYITNKEQEEKEQRLASDPFHSFYESLPEDYEQRLKTDPDYASDMQVTLKQKVLDTSLTESERLQAMGQLQMTAGMLAEYDKLDSDNELSNAIMDIVNNTDDENTRIRALEAVTYGPNISPKLAPTFMEMLKTEDNNYVRNLAANGLGGTMYSQELDSETRRELADSIIHFMKNTSDPEFKTPARAKYGHGKRHRAHVKTLGRKPRRLTYGLKAKKEATSLPFCFLS